MLPNTFAIIKELGRGKSGISYLAKYKNSEVIVKEMHDETVPYYTFSKQKLELEIDAYEILLKQKIRIPLLIEYNRNENYIVKEYVPGSTITDKIITGDLDEKVFFELLRWESELKGNNINIDYFPNNFIINETGVYYIDYEINPYTEQWNFRNWGIYYWLNGIGFKLFKETKDPAYINMEGTGIPIKNLEIEKKRTLILQLYDKNDFNPALP